MTGDASLGVFQVLYPEARLPDLSFGPDAVDLLEQGLALAMNYGNTPFLVWERWIYRVQQFLLDEDMRRDEDDGEKDPE